MSFEDRDLWQSYESDAVEALREIEESLLELESDRTHSANIHRLYRGLHSIKGNSGFLQLASIERLAHVSEDLIGLVRDGGVPLDSEIVELMLQSVDRLRSMIEEAARERRDGDIARVSLLIDQIFEAYLVRGGKRKEGAAPAFQLFESVRPSAQVAAPIAQDPETLALFLALARTIASGVDAVIGVARLAAPNADERRRLRELCDQLATAAERTSLEAVALAARQLGTAAVADAIDAGQLELYRALASCEEQYRNSAPAPEDFQHAARLERLLESRAAPLVQPTARVEVAVTAPAGKDERERAPAARSSAAEAPAAAADRSRADVLRVDAHKVSLIMDLASEIGLACGAVTHHPEIAQLELEGFASAAHKLELLVRELQNEVSALRLVPIAGVFQRMKRVVRDAARRTNKEVELVLEGEETEIDKVMVDSLHDPLVHVLRNSIDHGIEPAADRVRSGKPAVGKIVLSASYEGGEVSVEVRDDGRGLDAQRILARAFERGLVAERDEKLSEQAIYDLLFLPGFSTKAVADELSGRGVGMDVVKTTIEGMRGRVTLRSQTGKGFRLNMTMPLTLAFVEAMVVRERERLYALPIERVLEVFKAQHEQLSYNSADGRTMIRVRERLFPVLWLHRFWDEHAECEEVVEDRVVVVVQTSRGGLAIPVDWLLGNQQVMLKPLRGALQGIRAGAGCGVLRTGDVALTLDCERLHV